jgi:cell shape-determining protein MreD
MRSATLVLVCYGLMVVTGVLWARLPIGPFRLTPPDLAALTAGYLGLTARRGIAGAVASAVVAGYLADLLSGAPPGLLALVAGVICVLAFLIQRRILVRGRALTLAFAASLGLAAEILVWLLLAFAGEPQPSLAHPLLDLAMVALTTGVVGLGALRLYRRVDAAFARTHRERDHALEGLTP